MKVIRDLLQKRRSLTDFVQVPHSKVINIHVQRLCDLEHDSLGDVHSLRTTEASERCVADRICLANVSTDPSVRNVIAVVDVRTSPVPITVSLSYHCAQEDLT